MNIGDTFKINNKKYKVIDMLKKKHYEQDLIICVTDSNYKECFQRFDLDGGQEHIVEKERSVFNAYY